VAELKVLWVRFFKVSDGVYDIAALVENPNIFAAAASFRFRFKLHDADGVLIALRDGTTFINPQERFVIFDSQVQTIRRIPAKASVEFDIIPWERKEIRKLSISSFGYQFQREPFGRLEMTVRNEDIFDAKNIEVIVVLLDRSRNAFAVNRTQISGLGGESEKKIGFSWPDVFFEEPVVIEVYSRSIP